jgi:hypothetical protein
MRVRTFTVLFLLMAIYLVITVAAEVFVDEYVKPHTMFAYLVISTALTGLASLTVDLDVPS